MLLQFFDSSLQTGVDDLMAVIFSPLLLVWHSHVRLILLNDGVYRLDAASTSALDQFENAC